MKNFKLLYILLISVVVIFAACEDKFPEPEDIQFTADIPDVSVYDNASGIYTITVNFSITGTAEFLTVWPGDEGHNYDAYLQQISSASGTTALGNRYNDKGEIIVPIVNDTRDGYTGTLDWEYEATAVGTSFTAILIASTIQEYGESASEVRKEIVITIPAAE